MSDSVLSSNIYKRAIQLSYGRYVIKRCGFWFVDVPRTSSTSIKSELGKRFGIVYGKRNVIESGFSTKQMFRDHIAAANMKSLIGAGSWDKLFTFSLVRNPWDRVFSMYHYRRKVRNSFPDSWSFSDYVCRLSEATADSKYFASHIFRYGASDFLLDANGELIVDFVAKFEQRNEGLGLIASRLNLSDFGGHKVQAAKPSGQHYSEFYNAETRGIVADLYSKDVELFGYSFETS